MAESSVRQADTFVRLQVPVTMDKTYQVPVTMDKTYQVPVAMDKTYQVPVTMDKNIPGAYNNGRKHTRCL